MCGAAVLQEEMAMAAASRRMSVAPVNRAASNIRNMSGRHGSMFYGRSTFIEGSILPVLRAMTLFRLHTRVHIGCYASCCGAVRHGTSTQRAASGVNVPLQHVPQQHHVIFTCQ